MLIPNYRKLKKKSILIHKTKLAGCSYEQPADKNEKQKNKSI